MGRPTKEEVKRKRYLERKRNDQKKIREKQKLFSFRFENEEAEKLEVIAHSLGYQSTPLMCKAYCLQLLKNADRAATLPEDEKPRFL